MFSGIGGDTSQVHSVNYLNDLVHEPKDENAASVYKSCDSTNTSKLPSFNGIKETPNIAFKMDEVSTGEYHEYFVSSIDDGEHR